MAHFDDKYDVVVIGAGLAGLSCGAFLAKGGKRVKVFERNQVPGGCCTTFQRKGFKFDSGPFYCRDVEPGDQVYDEEARPIYETIDALNIRKEVQFYQTDKMRYIFSDGPMNIPTTMNEAIRMLSEKFPHERQGIKNLFRVCTEIKNAVNQHSTSPIISKYKDKNANDLVADYLKDRSLKNLITGIGFIGLTSDKFSAITKAHALLRRWGPIYSPADGMQSLTNAYVKGLQKYGGELEFGTMITGIITEKGKAIGVKTKDNKRIGANYVVSAVAALQTFGDLIEEKKMDKEYMNWFKTQEVSMSAFLVYLGVDLDIREMDVASINYVHETANVEQGYEACMKGHFEDAWFVVYVPSLFNPTLCPNVHGKNENIVIIHTYAPYEIDWEKRKDGVANLMIEKAERIIPNLKKHIIVREAATPLTFERYTMNTRGAISGWRQTPEFIQAGRLDQKTPIKGLYLAGHWTRPGPRTTLSVISGRNAAELIMNEAENNRLTKAEKE